MYKRRTSVRVASSIVIGVIFVLVAIVASKSTFVRVTDVKAVSSQSCSYLNGSVPGWEGGPYTNEHAFPRLFASDGDYSLGQITTDNLDRLSLYNIVWKTSSAPFWTNDPAMAVDNYFSYLRNRNRHIKIMAVFHAYGIMNASSLFDCEKHPTICDITRATETANGGGGNWWLRDYRNGSIIQPGSWETISQAMVNASLVDPNTDSQGKRYTQWLAEYMLSNKVWNKYYNGTRYWDGILVETLSSSPHYFEGGSWDLDENGIADIKEHGKPWIDKQWTGGWKSLFTTILPTIEADGGVVGGHAWEPGIAGIDSDPEFADVNHVALSAFPRGIYYDPDENEPYRCDGPYSNLACGTWGSDDQQKRWDFHMMRYLWWMDNARKHPLYVLFIDNDLSDDSYYGLYITDYKQQTRWTLGTTLLDNGYAQIKTGQFPATWCDECGVDKHGRSVESLDATGWLGCPVMTAVNMTDGRTLREMIDIGQGYNLSDYVWKREFENGMVIVNPTKEPKTVSVGQGWKKIRGSSQAWGDQSHNTGESVSNTIRLNPLDAYVLVRDGALVPTLPALTPQGQACSDKKLLGDYNCDDIVNRADINTWLEEFSEGLSKLRFFEYIRRALYQ